MSLRVLLLLAIGLSASANWSSRRSAHPQARRELVTKPLTTVLIVVLAATIASTHGTGRWLVVAGLVFCLIGDVLLLPQVDTFIAGLAAFLVGHVLFGAAALQRDGARLVVASAVIAVAVAIVVGVLGRRIVAGARQRDPALGVAVVAYLAVIAAMATVVASTGSAVAVAGALLFVTSDTLLGFDLFVRPVRGAHIAIMMTYHAALVALTLGLLGS